MGEAEWLLIPRYRCSACKKLHRVLPEFMVGFKQYTADVIQDATSGMDVDGPCDMTVKRWNSQVLHGL